jgi:ADP-ribosylglycohydrolase/adenylate kinase family enzyme
MKNGNKGTGVYLIDRIKGFLIGLAVGNALAVSKEMIQDDQSDPRPRIEDGPLPESNTRLYCFPRCWAEDSWVALTTVRGITVHLETGEKLAPCFHQACRKEEFWGAEPDEISRYSQARYGLSGESSFAAGAIMRVAPVAVYAVLMGYDRARTAALAYRTARMTHRHPLAVFPAVELVLSLTSILSDHAFIPDTLTDPASPVQERNPIADADQMKYREKRSRPPKYICEDSDLFVWRWVLEECFCLKPGGPWSDLPPFAEGMALVLKPSSNIRTVGAIGGALLGAYHGLEGIPERWRRSLAGVEIFLEAADKLTTGALNCRKPLALVPSKEKPAAKKIPMNRKRFRLPGQPGLETFFQEQVIDIIENPGTYRRMGFDFPGGIILHGAPGTGKTFAAEALAGYLKWPRFDITAESIGDKWIHETSRKIGAVFKEAMLKAPALIIIDEMESFLGRRDDEQNGRIEEINEFLRQVPRAAEKGVLVIGLTNRIDQIDPAFLRRGRFDHIIKVEMPKAEAVETVLADLLARRPCATGLSFQSYVPKLAGRPLSDAAFFVRESSRLAASSNKDRIDDLCLARAMKAVLARDGLSASDQGRMIL